MAGLNGTLEGAGFHIQHNALLNRAAGPQASTVDWSGTWRLELTREALRVPCTLEIAEVPICWQRRRVLAGALDCGAEPSATWGEEYEDGSVSFIYDLGSEFMDLWLHEAGDSRLAGILYGDQESLRASAERASPGKASRFRVRDLDLSFNVLPKHDDAESTWYVRRQNASTGVGAFVYHPNALPYMGCWTLEGSQGLTFRANVPIADVLMSELGGSRGLWYGLLGAQEIMHEHPYAGSWYSTKFGISMDFAARTGDAISGARTCAGGAR
jgi:hypothetical protein